MNKIERAQEMICEAWDCNLENLLHHYDRLVMTPEEAVEFAVELADEVDQMWLERIRIEINSLRRDEDISAWMILNRLITKAITTNVMP